MCFSLIRASIFFARSPVHLNRLQQLYLLNRKAPLTRHVKANVQGHLCKALLYALEGGKKDVTGCCEFLPFATTGEYRKLNIDCLKIRERRQNDL